MLVKDIEELKPGDLLIAKKPVGGEDDVCIREDGLAIVRSFTSDYVRMPKGSVLLVLAPALLDKAFSVPDTVHQIATLFNGKRVYIWGKDFQLADEYNLRKAKENAH